MTAHNGVEPAGTAACRVCQEFELAESVARSEKDESRATDCRVLRRRHRDAEHAAHGEQGEQS